MTERVNVFAPYDQSVIKELTFESEDAMRSKLERAYALFKDQESWLPVHKRIEILQKIAAMMRSRYDEIVETSAREGGKPLIDTKVEMDRAINGVNLAIEHIGNWKGEQVPMGLTAASANRMAFTFREPIGVVAAISAFNHPINLIIHQTIPAIAVGSPVIIKPAVTTPLTCLALLEIYKEAGLPEGWCESLICDNEVAEKLVTDPKVNFFSFIGSAKVGWYLRSKLAPGTRCALEHGGAAPVIVEPDAEIETLVQSLTKGGFYHAGQVCVSVQRVFVHESIIEEVTKKLADLASSLVTGDPLDEQTEVGPLISPDVVNRIDDWVKEAKSQGAEVVLGGKKISDTCYEPTILLNPDPQSKVSTSEIFGPVVCLYSYRDINEAIARANDIPYHFQAAIYTSNIDKALLGIHRLDATAVMVNDHTA
ncbi:MAG: aldehyde dehydrogenase family protein, partial [Bacteroidota bacterium]